MDSGVLEMYCVNWREHVGMQTFCFGAVKKLPFIYGHFFREVHIVPYIAVPFIDGTVPDESDFG